MEIEEIQQYSKLGVELGSRPKDTTIVTLDERWANVLNSKTINGFEFNLVLSYDLLKEYASLLNLCSAHRKDLKEEFLTGTMLRYSVHQGGKLQALIAVRPDGISNHKPFRFYGLSYNHSPLLLSVEKKDVIELSNWTPEHSEPFVVNKSQFNSLCESFYNFRDCVIANETSFSNIRIQATNYYPY